MRRCLTLARALRKNWDICFASRAGTAETVPALGRAGYRLISLADGGDEAKQLVQDAPRGCDLLVVDHYGLDASFEGACRGWAKRIVVLDDLADRPHDCDVLVDQTPGRQPGNYAKLVAPSCQVLAGAAYALLDPRFRQRRAMPRRAPEIVRAVLVNFGGTDPDGATRMAVDALIDAKLDGPFHIVLDSRNSRFAEVAALAASRAGATLLSDVEDMAGLMSECDMALGAGGVTALERCCIGLPSLIAQVAENQRGNAMALATGGAAQNLGAARVLDKKELVAALKSLAADQLLRQSMALAGRMLVDGLGAARVAAACLPPLTTHDGRVVSLRLASIADSDRMLEWQSAPGIRAFSRHPNPPDRASHETWLRRKLCDPHCVFHVIELGGEAGGVLRLDRLERDDVFEVSILVAPDWHQKGAGSAALALAARTFPAAELRATIRSGNVTSVRMFERQGYVRVADEEWRLSPRRD